MGIGKHKDRKGKIRFVASKFWPDGSRLRKYCPSHEAAKKLLNRATKAILDGTWSELKAELAGKLKEEPTIREFYERFLEEYCKARMKSWKRYELSFKSINEHLGDLRLKEFTREHMHRFMKARSGAVSKATTNRDLSALRRMFSYALECGMVSYHPLLMFPKFREGQKVFAPISLKEYRALIEAMRPESLKAMVAVMGETALRKEETLGLCWDGVDLRNRILSVCGKGDKVRSVPLSDLAVEHLSSLVRYLQSPYVFVNPRFKDRWVNPDKPLRAARKAVGVTVTWHDLRRFRCTRWLMAGVDIRTVKELMGHADISTTMRYAAYVNAHAKRSIQEAWEFEEKELRVETNWRQSK